MNTTDICSCGAQPSQWEEIQDQVVRPRGPIIFGFISAIFSALVFLTLISAIAQGEDFSQNTLLPLFALFLGGGSAYLSYKCFTAKDREQVLRCRVCETTVKRVVPDCEAASE